jgi:Fe-S-cluster containining protein
MVYEESMGTGEPYNHAMEIVAFELDILGKMVDFHICVGKGQAKLGDIVPLARELCTNITEVVLHSIRSDGGHIPCCKGCSICCSNLVPLSVPEALRLKEEISAVPADRRESIKRTCILASRLILNQKPPGQSKHQIAEAPPAYQVDLNPVSDWYASLNLACPFLDNDLCIIYEQRPLACREHFVEGSARACRGQRGTAEVIEMPMQVPNALAQLASEFEGTSVEAVLLPLVLVWCQKNQERAERTWPSEMMVRRFVEIIKEMAYKNSTVLVV